MHTEETMQACHGVLGRNLPLCMWHMYILQENEKTSYKTLDESMMQASDWVCSP